MEESEVGNFVRRQSEIVRESMLLVSCITNSGPQRV
jgi:hypothetical protein